MTLSISCSLYYNNSNSLTLMAFVVIDWFKTFSFFDDNLVRRIKKVGLDNLLVVLFLTSKSNRNKSKNAFIIGFTLLQTKIRTKLPFCLVPRVSGNFFLSKNICVFGCKFAMVPKIS